MDWNEELYDGIGAEDTNRVREALAHGADSNNPHIGECEGTTPLYWAADKSPAIVRLLIEAGATVSAEQPEDRHTSLHRAAESASVEVLGLLLTTDLGPHLGTFDYVDRTPLHCAVDTGIVEAARVLLEAGADVNARDEERIGNPPLQEAVEKGDLPMVRLLLEYGADPTIPGWMNLTPLDKARQGERGDRQIIRELLEEAARSRGSETRFQRDAGHSRGKR